MGSLDGELYCRTYSSGFPLHAGARESGLGQLRLHNAKICPALMADEQISAYSACLGPARPDGLTTVLVDFGAPASNDKVVQAALAALRDLRLGGGRGVLFNGPASLPVAMALAHAVAHLYEFVACYDPKISRYVVAISHTPDLRPGDLLQ